MKTWTFLDRTSWGCGLWDGEPDKAQWTDPTTGLVCLTVRNHMGCWCGYVGVPEGHPAYQKGYYDVNASVHGGLTFADFCQENNAEHGVCHIPEPGQPDNVWWLGFDCCHLGDLMPCRNFRSSIEEFIHDFGNIIGPKTGPGETYRTLDYVQAECRSLAAQLATMSRMGAGVTRLEATEMLGLHQEHD